MRSTDSPPTSASASCAATRQRSTGCRRPSKHSPVSGLTPPQAEPAQPGLVAGLTALISEYDQKWLALDFAGVAGLWVRDSPQPIYIGDEYPTPLIGAEALDRHW